MRGLLSVGVDKQQWVVPAIHAVWIPPHREHSLRSHGAYSGWSVYIEETACALLPAEPCTIRTSALLREAVKRAASWGGAGRAQGPRDGAFGIGGDRGGPTGRAVHRVTQPRRSAARRCPRRSANAHSRGHRR
jgi:hypothetical protein